MGHELNTRDEQHGTVISSAAPWLDARSAALAHAIAGAVGEHHEVQAAILFGSVARHDERPLEDDEPSDVDLLILADPGVGRSRLSVEQQLAIYETVGRMRRQYGDTPREVQVTLTEASLADWDATFIENVARDGVLLWARGPLPASLARLAARGDELIPSLQQG